MKSVVLFVAALAVWFVYFQTLDWFMMKVQGLNYFIGIFG